MMCNLKKDCLFYFFAASVRQPILEADIREKIIQKLNTICFGNVYSNEALRESQEMEIAQHPGKIK